MLIRVLIVLLAVLNLGVALWWMTRSPPQPPQPPELPSGVAQLQLVRAAGPAPAASGEPAAPAVAATAATATADPPPAPDSPAAAAAPAQCFSLGPFTEAGLAVAAAERLKGHVQSAKPRTLPGASASGYRVLMPAVESREAAQAMAQRIGAAGFDDFLVINTGEEANSIALGRYRSREAALRRQTSLRAAGFAAQLLPIGREATPQWWLDVALSGSGDAAQLRRLAASAQSVPLDCAALR
ncbi:SPOR domain-containing protein [Pseudoxanthomonas wuyuanensis]